MWQWRLHCFSDQYERERLKRRRKKRQRKRERIKVNWSFLFVYIYVCYLWLFFLFVLFFTSVCRHTYAVSYLLMNEWWNNRNWTYQNFGLPFRVVEKYFESVILGFLIKDLKTMKNNGECQLIKMSTKWRFPKNWLMINNNNQK